MSNELNGNDPNEQLAGLRAQIDELDQQLVDLLAKRALVTTKVGQIKSHTGMSTYVPEDIYSFLEFMYILEARLKTQIVIKKQ